MKIYIDDREIEAERGETVLEAARRTGIHIPTLCYHEAFGGQGNCRLCMVEVNPDSGGRIVASCTYPVSEGMKVRTSNPQIDKIRSNIIRLLYQHAPNSLLLKTLYKEYLGPDNITLEDPFEKCILCRLCVNACAAVGVSAIATIMRGTEKRVSTPYDEASTACIGCAACAQVCPTGAIEVQENGEVRRIWNRDFEMVACTECGKKFATREEIAYIKDRGIEQDDIKLCDNCRRKKLARQLQAFNN